MKRVWILCLMIPLLLAATRPPLVGVTSAPSGACNTSEIWVVFASGAQYQCVAGTWTLMSDPIVSTEIDTSAEIAAIVTDETGTGALCFATSPTLVTPVLGTPSSCTLTNCTGLPISSGVSGLGSGVATFLGTPSSANLASAVTNETGSGALCFATSPALVTPALGTPASGTLTSCTGLPISTGVSGLGSGVATFLATASSANFAGAITDETGTGAAVLAVSPALTTNPTCPTQTVQDSDTSMASTAFVNAEIVADLDTSAEIKAICTDETGSGLLVFATSPTLTTPVVSCTGCITDTNVAETITLSFDHNIDTPVAGDSNKLQIYFPSTATITRIACSVDTGSIPINFDERAEATPNTAGTNTLTSNLTCSTTTGTTTTFADSSIAARVPYNLQVAAPTGTPTIVRIHVEYTLSE